MMNSNSVISLSTKYTFVLLLIATIPILVNGISYLEDITLTLKQKEILDQFRDLMIDRLPHDYMKEDIYLIKWLRAAHFNLKDAEDKLLQNLRWRKIERMDAIHEEDWSDMYNTNFKYYLDGRDKYGRSFLYFETSDFSIRRTVISGKINRLTRYANKAIDEACELVRNLGEKYHNITRGHLIINLVGFNAIEHGCLQCVPFLLRIPLTYQNNYPGCEDYIILLNAPSTIQPLLNLIRPLIDPDLWNRIKIYGSNKSEWKIELEKLGFDFTKLPPEAGGTAVYKGMDVNDY